MTQTISNQQKISYALMGILVCGVIFFIVAGLIIDGSIKWVYITAEEVHQRIRSEIPSGSTYFQVTDFLKKYDWGGTSKLSEFNNFGTQDDILTKDERQKIKWNHGGGIKTIAENPVWGWGIHMKFYYDEEEKLVTYNLVEYRY